MCTCLFTSASAPSLEMLFAFFWFSMMMILRDSSLVRVKYACQFLLVSSNHAADAVESVCNCIYKAHFRADHGFDFGSGSTASSSLFESYSILRISLRSICARLFSACLSLVRSLADTTAMTNDFGRTECDTTSTPRIVKRRVGRSDVQVHS